MKASAFSQARNMEVVIANQQPEVIDEASQIARFVKDHYDALRDNALTDEALPGGLKVRFFQQGRNIVYQIRNRWLWYLKIPRNGKIQGIEGESRGFRFADNVWQSLPHYMPPPAVITGHNPPFIITAEITGTQLNYLLYRSCWPFFNKTYFQMTAVMTAFGSMLAAFHKAGVSVEAPAISRSYTEKLGRRLEKAKRLDDTGQSIVGWLNNHPLDDTPHTLIHDNCTFRNILFDGEHIHLLDYETCGMGSRYNDISRICCDIMFTRAAFAFPWRRAYRLLSVFLEAYHAVFPIDQRMLLRYIACYAFDRYVQVYLIKESRESIAGIPISRRKLIQLHRYLLDDNIKEIFKTIIL